MYSFNMKSLNYAIWVKVFDRNVYIFGGKAIKIAAHNFCAFVSSGYICITCKTCTSGNKALKWYWSFWRASWNCCCGCQFGCCGLCHADPDPDPDIVDVGYNWYKRGSLFGFKVNCLCNFLCKLLEDVGKIFDFERTNDAFGRVGVEFKGTLNDFAFNFNDW